MLKADSELGLVGKNFYHACVQDRKKLLHGPNVAYSLLRLSKPEERGTEEERETNKKIASGRSHVITAVQSDCSISTSWTNLYFLES